MPICRCAVMMYEALAACYDALVQDEAATAAWVKLIEETVSGQEVLEVACGSGEITIALARKGYAVYASDRSEAMLKQARQKKDAELVKEWKRMDMRALEGGLYDGILCLCDSFNYLLEEEDVRRFFQRAWEHLRPGGVLLVDMHSLDRLAEFREEYNEAGRVNEQSYQWTIESEEDCIYQTFAFYDAEGRAQLEQHIQRVYDPQWILSELKRCGFVVEVKTDFTKDGIVPGEKQFYIGRRGME